MKYVLFETQRAVIMTECAMGELMDSEYKVFYMFSAAVDYFQGRVGRFNPSTITAKLMTGKCRFLHYHLQG